MSYETATKRKSEKCAIRLYRVKGPRIGGPGSPFGAGYVLKACLTAFGNTDPIEEVTFPLPSGRNPDKWCDINLNPQLIRRAENLLISKARKLGYKSVVIRDHQDDPSLKGDHFPPPPSRSKVVATRALSRNG